MRLILLLSVIFFSTAAPAQTAVWKRFGVDEGLSSTTITAIIQSRDGIMWFGAQNGLTRFDGSSFKKVAVPKNEIQPYIQALAIDKNNLLWAGTRTGLWSYDKNTRQLVHHHYEGKHISNITALVFDSLSQKLYATTFEGTVIIDVDRFPQGVKRIGSSQHVGIQLIKNNFFTIHHSFFIKYNETRSDTLSEAIAYGKGFAWYKKEACFLLVSTSGICTIDTNGRMQKPDLNIDKSKLADESTFFIDRKDRLWINAMDTLYCFKSTSDQAPLKYTWNKANPYSPFVPVNCMYEDKEGNTWVGTSGYGCAILNVRTGKISFTPSSQLNATAVWSILHDKAQKVILYGTSNNLAVYNIASGKYRLLPKPVKNKRFTVTNIANFDDRSWVVSSYGSGAFMVDKQTFRFSSLKGLSPEYAINMIGVLPDKNLLVATSSGLFHYNTGTHKAKPYYEPVSVLWLQKMRDGSMAYGKASGIGFITGQGAKTYGLNNDSTKYDYSDVVFSLHETKNKRLFAASIKGGVFEFNPRTKKFTRVALMGDPSIAYCFADVNDSSFVVTTNNGLVLYNHYTSLSKVLNKNNGLPFNDFDQFGCFIDDDLFAGSGPEGIVLMNRKELLSLFSDAVELRLRHNDEVVRSITIAAGTQSLTTHVYTGIQQTTHALTYQYTLQGLETGWHSIEKGTEITYNYLPPGDYTLLVKATDENNVVASRQISIPVYVIPLWYQTSWFRAMLVLLAALILVLAVRYASWLKLKWQLRKLEAEQKVANERMRISRELHDNVGSQLTYLITGLEASEMMLKQQKTQTLNDNLEQLQQSARDSMQQLRDSIWALNNEDMTLSTLAERFKNWVHKMLAMQATVLKFETDIEDDVTIDAIKALSIFRLLQETVHNTIKHAEAGEIFVTVLSRRKHIRIQVYDNGKGFVEAQTDGSGLNNMRARAKELGAHVFIESEPGKGTTVTLTLSANTLNG